MMDKYQIEKSKDNYEILKINSLNKSVYIGSKYNEKREIDKFISQIDIKTEKDIYVVLGLGMANHLYELIKVKHSKAKIVVVECEEQWVEKFKVINSKSVLKNLTMVKNLSEIQEYLYSNVNEYNVNYLKVVSYANYDKIFKDELKSIINTIKEYQMVLKANINTRHLFAQTWFKSTMENIKYLTECETINEYRDIHKGKPAIIVSAGPSLNKNISELKKNTGAMIFCGGRTLKSVINEGINPDYTVIVDPMEKSYDLVEGYIEKIKTNLIFNIGIQNDILVNQKGKKIIYNNEGTIDEFFDNEVGRLDSEGSVAHCMVSAAIKMGCNPIIFIGQDFAYTDDKGHADVAISPWQNNDLANYSSNHDIFVKSIDGGIVRTSKDLYRYKRGMEKIIEINKEVEFINATEGGALISGCENRKLSEVIVECNSNGEKDIVSYEGSIRNDKVKQRLILKLNKSISAIEKSINLYDDAIKILNLFYKSIGVGMKNQDNYNIQLKKIDDSIYKLAEDIVFCDDILYPVMYKSNMSPKYVLTTEDNEKTARMKIIQCNLDLYKSISETLETNLFLIKKALNEIENMGDEKCI